MSATLVVLRVRQFRSLRFVVSFGFGIQTYSGDLYAHRAVPIPGSMLDGPDSTGH